MRLRRTEGVTLGEVFSFVSGLYFRGKLTYARAFARPPEGRPGVFIITSNDGLRLADEVVNQDRLRRFARGSIDASNLRYRKPLVRDARTLLTVFGPECEVVLLGSVASGRVRGSWRHESRRPHAALRGRRRRAELRAGRERGAARAATAETGAAASRTCSLSTHL